MPRVVALVLTYRSPVALQTCLAAIDAQTTRPHEVVVVDNDGGVEAEGILASRSPGGVPARVIGLSVNSGPAGGHAAGLGAFASSAADWAWVMDDDVVPDPGALETLLATAGDRTDVVVLPRCRDMDTAQTWGNNNGWLGVMVPRAAVERAGVPDEELVWWTEDTEYLQWRLPRAGFERVETDQVVIAVRRARASSSKPAWKYYYETRNHIHYRLRVQRPTPGATVPRHLTRRVRLWRAARSTSKLAARAMFREPRGRGERMAMVARGAVDGVAGRLGRRVEPGDPDRPTSTDADPKPAAESS